jgi:hypothetical protein
MSAISPRRSAGVFSSGVVIAAVSSGVVITECLLQSVAQLSELTDRSGQQPPQALRLLHQMFN